MSNNRLKYLKLFSIDAARGGGECHFCRTCVTLRIQRKTAQPSWKMLPLLVLNHDSAKLSNRKLGGRNGESAMTRGVNEQGAGGGISVRIFAHVRLAPRPSLGSSLALLLLLSCP
jgi:hypothetical protein